MWDNYNKYFEKLKESHKKYKEDKTYFEGENWVESRKKNLTENRRIKAEPGKENGGGAGTVACYSLIEDEDNPFLEMVGV